VAEQGQLLHSALAHKSDLQEAHVALAEHCLRLHTLAEGSVDSTALRGAELRLRAALSKVSHERPEHARFARYLAGDGRLSLSTSPPNAKVELCVHRSDHRRRVLRHVAHLGPGPIVDHPLPMGSYVVRLRKEGFHDVDYPVSIERQGVWDTRTPSGESSSVQMHGLGTLGRDDCYVPAGWCSLGGDPQTPNSLPKQRVWVDGFVIRRFSVTHQEYLEFVNALIRAGDREGALAHVPRQQTSAAGETGAMVYRMSEEGEFTLSETSMDDPIHPLHPVTLVKWASARAYARWLRKTSGRPWRLPMEFEWEKAARGVDGRYFPWGDEFDPSRSCMKDSHDGAVKIGRVDSFPVDESVYGVRGTAGNTRDWCLDKFREEGPPLEGRVLVLPSAADLADAGFKSTRGGSYGNSAARARSADRDWWFPDRAYVGRGFRVAWGIDDADTEVEELPPRSR
jgi:serine/threonine-protein kinase